MRKEVVYLNLFDLVLTSSFWKVVIIVWLPTIFAIALYIACLLLVKRRDK